MSRFHTASSRATFALLLAISAVSLSTAAPAIAQPPLLTGLGGTSGFGTDCLSTNDDGSSDSIDLTPAFPGGLRFFGRTHTRAFVNTNGNITFNEDLGTYTPAAFPVADQPMIAPYWADVDIRGEACDGFGGNRGCADPTENGVWWHLEPGLMVVTWHNVGYFSCLDDKKMNFQLILTAVDGGCGLGGDFDVEFRFNRCEWHTGDASGGEDGFCDPDPVFESCTPAQSGFDAGNLSDFVEIMGSRSETIHTTLCAESNIGDPGIWHFQIRSGDVICPGAGDTCDTGMVGVCNEGLTTCVGAGIECLSLVPASEERCDALDNDCDGTVDEGDDICGELSVCELGVCQPLCFEGGCDGDQVCNDAGRCIDAGCDGVTCETGQRCLAGSCVDACEGIVCPEPFGCRAGQCLNICDELTCDECTVCDGAGCVPRCPDVACPSGTECNSTGFCVDTGCTAITCGAGEACVSGSCQDSCIAAVCPSGQECVSGVGECLSINRPMPEEDGGAVVPDSGTTPPGDGSIMCPVGFDCGEEEDGGCGCSIPGAAPGGNGWPMAAFGAILAFVAIRRRRRR